MAAAPSTDSEDGCPEWGHTDAELGTSSATGGVHETHSLS
ncbi:hypothetical protein SAMN05443636_1207 [Halobaculum gomorrense]|uniref:Uncharacterized protein n=1 Tax=Halobaculum gomorrense TaxID=43928 RepID=A0A1M5MZE0_9EURY|nr:hypothetical protein SAMN05443636_1207 [Halobaculum gomorrense]